MGGSAASSSGKSNSSQQLHFDNKIYERFEGYIQANRDPNFLSTFTGGHKRSPSGESLGRNLGELLSGLSQS